jgi:UDP-glucose 4-epimerase
MHVLVTGGAGQIGSTLSERLVRKFGARVTIVDDLSTGNLQNVLRSARVTFVRANVNRLLEAQDVFSSSRFDAVFHLAAVVGVRRTLENPSSVFADIDGIQNVVELARASKVDHYQHGHVSRETSAPRQRSA